MTNNPDQASLGSVAIGFGAYLLLATGCIMTGITGSWLPTIGVCLATWTAQACTYAVRNATESAHK